MKRVLFLAAGLAALSTASVRSQSYETWSDTSLTSWTLYAGSIAAEYDSRQTMARIARNSAIVSQRDRSATLQTTAATRFTFIPSRARRDRNLASFVAKVREVDPAGASKMQALFASTDIIVALGRELEAYGLKTDDFADAYTVYWVQAW
jgi:hypothetical protein